MGINCTTIKVDSSRSELRFMTRDFEAGAVSTTSPCAGPDHRLSIATEHLTLFFSLVLSIMRGHYRELIVVDAAIEYCCSTMRTVSGKDVLYPFLGKTILY